jgi:glycine dehydrogenase subunit 1
MDYIPHTAEDIDYMMQETGVHILLDLFDTVPPEILIDDAAAATILTSGTLPAQGMTEPELRSHLARLAGKNKVYRSIFRGAGSYWHYIPAVVDYLASRGEFWTSYTPYQAERSQGYLQAIFEYQSLIAGLTGMKFSNASLHDGATALVDAIVMAQSQVRNRSTVVFAGVVNPMYMTAVATALRPRDLAFKQVEASDVEAQLDGGDVLAVVVCSPDFFGIVHDVAAIVQAVKNKDPNVLVIQCITEALSLALLKSPGAAGVDIVVGEAQSFGIPMFFGGPALGFMAVADPKLLHKLPGRIVGATKELHGDRIGFTLTLTAREQHIRREKALSNICSNEALNMLRAAIHIVALGATGLKQAATLSVRRAHYLKQRLATIGGFSVASDNPTFNEFVVTTTPATARLVQQACEEHDVLGPLDLGIFNPGWAGMLLFCVTEMNTMASIDGIVAICSEAAQA